MLVLRILSLLFALTGTTCDATVNEGGAAPSVTLDYGTFAGFKNVTSGITRFLGIRYADAPTGNLRWRSPVSPPSQHLGAVDATGFGNACIAATQTEVTPGTSEDCLFGNVYVPINSNKSERKLPVLVYFHGGGFQGGSTHDISPDSLLQQPNPIIFVSFEYRVGQFGFLGGTRVKEDGMLNAGLLDQCAALRWVQLYISQFGGDERRVTIWGQSAGAGSTMFHLLGNGGNNEGLFRAAMGDSPSLSFLPSFTDAYVQGIFDQVSAFAGCGNETDATVMSCLRSASVSQLTLAGSQTVNSRPATLFTFAPIIDDSFLRERPVEAFASGHFAHIPVLFGSNTNEGSGWSASLHDASANTSMPNATSTTVYNFIRGQFTTFTRASFERAVAEFYPLSDFAGSFSLQGQQMYGEMRYICTAALITGTVSRSAKGIEGYHFHYDNPDLGSFHGSELTAFFTGTTHVMEEDQALFSAMQGYWTSFVASGRPGTSKGAPLWSPVAKSEGSPRILLHPGNTTLEGVHGLAERCAFWHSISRELKG
ncbi:hypothetical protein Hypma_008425 [Hypsizygus marmoreus]|uniref:Carboxylic ester hydrolase n=1 Tax=Hypsizygus marmoreus TaxID=39966 RepID=A0A369JSN9_HYPMA|nr:hypothetical protein Hypma_008425 [Hypsizygus marmoreus]